MARFPSLPNSSVLEDRETMFLPFSIGRGSSKKVTRQKTALHLVSAKKPMDKKFRASAMSHEHDEMDACDALTQHDRREFLGRLILKGDWKKTGRKSPNRQIAKISGRG